MYKKFNQQFNYQTPQSSSKINSASSVQKLSKMQYRKPKLSLYLSVFPRMIAGDYYYYFFFHTKRGRLFEGRRLFKGDDYFKYCSLEVVPKIFCFIISSNQKIITSNKLNILWANFKCSKINMVPWLIFRAWIVTDQFCWIKLHFNLTGRG